MKRKLDNVWFGLIAGLVFPLAFAVTFIVSTYNGSYSLPDLLLMMGSDSMIVKLLCVAVFPDMCGVFLLNTLEMWHACRGVFAALGFYMLVCCIFLAANAV
ncbi:MAG: hypothetical protein ACI3Z7_03505 [Candidatus Aphodosoma sp.]